MMAWRSLMMLCYVARCGERLLFYQCYMYSLRSGQGCCYAVTLRGQCVANMDTLILLCLPKGSTQDETQDTLILHK